MIDIHIKDAVWRKGRPIPGFTSIMWRWDAWGRVMRYSDYGKRASEWGWEIDHIVPVSEGGNNDLSNLRPLNWVSNLQRQSDSRSSQTKK